MAGNAKRKTTMAKLNRETKLRERRANKQARKEARKLAPAVFAESSEDPVEDALEPGEAPALQGQLGA